MARPKCDRSLVYLFIYCSCWFQLVCWWERWVWYTSWGKHSSSSSSSLWSLCVETGSEWVGGWADLEWSCNCTAAKLETGDSTAANLQLCVKSCGGATDQITNHLLFCTCSMHKIWSNICRCASASASLLNPSTANCLVLNMTPLLQHSWLKSVSRL